MSLDYVIYDKKNKKIVSTIKKEQEEIKKLINSSNELIDFKDFKYRVGVKKTDKGTVYCLTSNKNYIKSSKMFNSDMNILVASLDKIYEAVEEAEKFAFRQVDILIHNLKTINAHSIQNMFYFLPQDKLMDCTIKEINREIKNKIKNDLDGATELIFKILKNNSEMKAEFSVFSKLYEDNPLLNIKKFNLHYSLINVIYNFFPDFTDKLIDLNFQEMEIFAYYDYESIHVALFHMIENITKYIKKDSSLKITYNTSYIDEVELIFDMISLRIENNELENIFEDGYSGEHAIKNNKSGKGIGLARVKKLLELNSGSIVVENLSNINDIYSNNIFKIKLKKDINSIR